jgi:putative DNA primase/helicase
MDGATTEADAARANNGAHHHQLNNKHLAQLRESGIADDVIAARGCYSERDRNALMALGFARYQALPGLLLPVLGIDHQTYQLRPDQPRVLRRKGKLGTVVKYESPAESRMLLDVHPYCRSCLADPSIPLVATEGIKKVDSIITAARREVVPLCAIGLLGVWGWRTKEGPLADWEWVRVRGRNVFLVFDSDLANNIGVQKALRRVSAFLTGRGATVNIVYLPGGPDGKKVGIDDYLVAGHTIKDVFALAGDRVSKSKSEPSAGQSVFRLSDTAALYVGEDDEPQFVCSRLEIVATTRNDKGEEWGRLLVFADTDKRAHEWAMPMSMLAGDGACYRE